VHLKSINRATEYKLLVRLKNSPVVTLKKEGVVLVFKKLYGKSGG